MAKESDIPGLRNGMFFEFFEFSPRSNFTEGDLHYILQFFGITMNEGAEIPHPRHFDGREFKPQVDITVAEVADILTAMDIQVSENGMNRLVPEELQGHFDDEGRLCPYDDITLEELLGLFTCKLFNVRLETDQFMTLPTRIKRHFIRHHRDGTKQRYGDRAVFK